MEYYYTFCIIFCIFFWVLCAIAIVLAMVWGYIQLQYYRWNKEERFENIITDKIKNEILNNDADDEFEDDLD